MIHKGSKVVILDTVLLEPSKVVQPFTVPHRGKVGTVTSCFEDGNYWVIFSDHPSGSVFEPQELQEVKE